MTILDFIRIVGGLFAIVWAVRLIIQERNRTMNLKRKMHAKLFIDRECVKNWNEVELGTIASDFLTFLISKDIDAKDSKIIELKIHSREIVDETPGFEDRQLTIEDILEASKKVDISRVGTIHGLTPLQLAAARTDPIFANRELVAKDEAPWNADAIRETCDDFLAAYGGTIHESYIAGIQAERKLT
jgi:hypothetical protein